MYSDNDSTKNGDTRFPNNRFAPSLGLDMYIAMKDGESGRTYIKRPPMCGRRVLRSAAPLLLVALLLLATAPRRAGAVVSTDEADFAAAGDDNRTAADTARLQSLADAFRIYDLRAAAAAKAPGDKQSLFGKLRVCISPSAPTVNCKPGAPPVSYTGYAVEVFRRIAARVPWLDDMSEWTFTCMPWADVRKDLMSANGTCVLALDAPYSKAWRLSRAIDRDGLLILVKVKELTARNLFLPFSTFTPGLWVLLFCSALSVGVILWFCDATVNEIYKPLPPLPTAVVARAPDAPGDGGANADAAKAAEEGRAGGGDKGAKKKDKDDDDGADADGTGSGDDDKKKGGDGKDGKDTEPAKPRRRIFGVQVPEEKQLKNLDSNMRQAILHLTRVQKPPFGVTLPAQIVLFAWGLCIMLTMALYTGATAAQLTSIALTGDVRDRNDLKGRSVVTWTEYAPRLAALGIPALGLPWNNATDEAAMVKWVRDERAAALVMHESWVRHVTSLQCDVAAAGLPFESTDTGIAMPLRAPAVLMEEIDRVIMQLASDGTLEKMKANLVINAGGSCSTPTVKKAKAISIGNVAGLWVILALAVLIAAVVLALMAANAARRRRKYRKLAARIEAANAAAAAANDKAAAEMEAAAAAAARKLVKLKSLSDETAAPAKWAA